MATFATKKLTGLDARVGPVTGADIFAATDTAGVAGMAYGTPASALSSFLGSIYQPLDPDLTALAALAGTGFATRTAANTWAQRSLVPPAAGFGITNPAGVAGNPTFALADDLVALEAMTGTGLVARTAANTYAQRTLTGTASQIIVTNGDGVAGDPTLALDMTALDARYVDKVSTGLQTILSPLRAPGGVGGGFQVGTTGEVGTDALGNVQIYGPNAAALKLVRISTGYYPSIASVATVINGSVADQTAFAGVAVMPSFQVVSGGAAASILFGRYSASALEARFFFVKSRSATVGGRGAVVASDYLGTLSWGGDDGTNPVAAANIRVRVAAIGAGVITGDLIFELSNASNTPAQVAGFGGATGDFQMGSGLVTVIDGNRILRPRSYTIVTLPTVTATGIIFCSDLGGEGSNLYSNGTAWVRGSDGAGIQIASAAASAFTWQYLTNAVYYSQANPFGVTNYAVTLGTTGIINGARAIFVREVASTGAGLWDIGGLKSLAPGTGCEVERINGAWKLKRYWAL